MSEDQAVPTQEMPVTISDHDVRQIQRLGSVCENAAFITADRSTMKQADVVISCKMDSAFPVDLAIGNVSHFVTLVNKVSPNLTLAPTGLHNEHLKSEDGQEVSDNQDAMKRYSIKSVSNDSAGLAATITSTNQYALQNNILDYAEVGKVKQVILDNIVVGLDPSDGGLNILEAFDVRLFESIGLDGDNIRFFRDGDAFKMEMGKQSRLSNMPGADTVSSVTDVATVTLSEDVSHSSIPEGTDFWLSKLFYSLIDRSETYSLMIGYTTYARKNLDPLPLLYILFESEDVMYFMPAPIQETH